MFPRYYRRMRVGSFVGVALHCMWFSSHPRSHDLRRETIAYLRRSGDMWRVFPKIGQDPSATRPGELKPTFRFCPIRFSKTTGRGVAPKPRNSPIFKDQSSRGSFHTDIVIPGCKKAQLVHRMRQLLQLAKLNGPYVANPWREAYRQN